MKHQLVQQDSTFLGLKTHTHTHAASVSHLGVDRDVAVAQRETGGGSGGYGRSREMNGVLIQSVKNGGGGTTVAHVHDAEG